MRYCSSGHANPDNTDFCVSCGQQLLASQPAPPPAAAPVPAVNPPAANPWGAPQPWSAPVAPAGGWQQPPYVQAPPPSNSNRGWILGGIAAGVVVLLLGVFILTRTGSNGGDAPTARPTSQATDPYDNDVPAGGSNSYQSDGEQILALLESQGVYVSSDPRSLDELAVTMCDALATGTSTTLLVSVAMDNGLSRNEATSLVAASIIVKCPWES